MKRDENDRDDAESPLVVAVTGTPGTGKTTATERLPDVLPHVEGPGADRPEEAASEFVPENVAVLHLNDAIRDAELYDEVDASRDSVVVDHDALASWVADEIDRRDADYVVLDSHHAHHLAVDRVVVLRCRPDVLEDRLRSRGDPEAKARENAASEALDLVLGEAVEEHGTDAVYEIDTTDRTKNAVAVDVARVLTGDREPSAGTVDYLAYATEYDDPRA